ncbi:DUF72 domain-containing protein [Lysobacter sp. F6437]|uniref:DUF72 domain-containing protein n=1 Tax=Lysobacter sp. F6437 TaxID=3459296 RepID=UPI00403DB61E
MTPGAPAVSRTPLARNRPHQLRTFERWAASVPATFRFSAKLPRAITHEAFPAMRVCSCGVAGAWRALCKGWVCTGPPSNSN